MPIKIDFIDVVLVKLIYVLYAKKIMKMSTILLIMMIKIIYVKIIIKDILLIAKVVQKIFAYSAKKSIMKKIIN